MLFLALVAAIGLLSGGTGSAGSFLAGTTPTVTVVAAPVDSELAIAIHGQDAILEMGQSAVAGNVAISTSGDLAQASMSWSMACQAWAWPVGILALAALFYLSTQHRRKE